MRFNSQNIKYTLFGIAIAATVFVSVAASTDWPEGQYMAVNTDRGIMIIDTHNGKYILERRSINTVNKLEWMKGDFFTSFKKAKDIGLHHSK